MSTEDVAPESMNQEIAGGIYCGSAVGAISLENPYGAAFKIWAWWANLLLNFLRSTRM